MISASIVTYKTNKIDIIKIASGKIIPLEIIIVDNSPTDDLSSISKYVSSYIHNPSNPGFGAGHNIAIKNAIEAGAKYHIIINPDIEIKGDVFTPMINYMEANPDVGMMMPKIVNEDGTVQNLPKLLPHPFWIFRRKLRKIDPFSTQFLNKYELRSVPKSQIYNVPILSGCFTLLRLDAIQEVGMYDERFFMYFEDFDLSRRMHQKYKTIYFPEVSVIHGYEGGANKSWKLFKVFVKSMATYFNKWGWFFDKEREKFNKTTLAQFK